MMPSLNGYATQTPPTSQGVSCLLARDNAGWSRSAFRESVVLRVEELPVKASAEEPSVLTSAVEVEPFSQALKQVYDLQFLPYGWDGNGAAVPTRASVDLTLHWLTSCYAQCKDVGLDWPWVNVAAGIEGEVVLEWWGRTRSVIVSVDAEGVRYHFSERGPGTQTRHTHGQASEPKELVGLLQWLVGK